MTTSCPSVLILPLLLSLSSVSLSASASHHQRQHQQKRPAFRGFADDPDTPLARIAHRIGYDDELSTPRAFFANASVLPTPREISNVLATQQRPFPDPNGLNNLFSTWGQFVDHDMDKVPETNGDEIETMHIPVPQGDARFDNVVHAIPFKRSKYFMLHSDTHSGRPKVRQQRNTNTPLVDASMVYGSTAHTAQALRQNNGVSCFLRKDASSLPQMKDGVMMTGDTRSGEQPGLMAIHAIFSREHNRLAQRLIDVYNMTNNETIYQTARLLVGAEIQQITIREYLPKIIGPPSGKQPKYPFDPNAQPLIFNEFAAACFRFGHTMVPERMSSAGADYCPIPKESVSLRDAFFNPTVIRSLGLDNIVRGMAIDVAEAVDIHVVDSLRDFLFEGRDGSPFGLDLAAVNIQRGRDHGLPNYCGLRSALGLPVTNLTYLKITGGDESLSSKLALLYGGDPCEMDLWVAILVERKATTRASDGARRDVSILGCTCRRVIRRQFSNVFRADKFHLSNVDWTKYGLDRDPQLDSDLSLSKLTLARVIELNSGVRNLPSDVFQIRQPVTGASCTS